jgi:hypothetical protein
MTDDERRDLAEHIDEALKGEHNFVLLFAKRGVPEIHSLANGTVELVDELTCMMVHRKTRLESINYPAHPRGTS